MTGLGRLGSVKIASGKRLVYSDNCKKIEIVRPVLKLFLTGESSVGGGRRGDVN